MNTHLTLSGLPPAHSHSRAHTGISRGSENLNYSQHESKALQSCAPSNRRRDMFPFLALSPLLLPSLPLLLSLSLSLSLPLFLPPRGLVFCRWAWRLTPSVLHHSLQQNQYLRTICAALLPGGWGLMLQLHLQFQTQLDLPGSDLQLISCRHYSRRKSAKCTAHTFTTAVQAGQPCSTADTHSSAFANLWEGRRLNSSRGLKVSWRDFELPFSPLMRCYIACKFSRHKCLSTS